MKSLSYRNKLFLSVAILVVTSGLAISLLVTYRQSRSLYAASAEHAEHMAHQLALKSAELIIADELDTLQKILHSNMMINPEVAYVYIILNGSVVAQAYAESLPPQFHTANFSTNEINGRMKQIVSAAGGLLMEVVWPLFGETASELRLGMSEKPHRQQVIRLGWQIIILSLSISICALVICYFLIRRITGPLTKLAEATERIEVDDDRMTIPVETNGHDEVSKLASHFNRMVGCIRDCNQRLQEKTGELDWAYQQTVNSLTIVQEIGAQPNIKLVCDYLIRKFKTVATCQRICLLIFSGSGKEIFLISQHANETIDANLFENSLADLKELDRRVFLEKDFLKPPLIPDDFQDAKRLVITPIRHEYQLIGLLVVACCGTCQCDNNSLEVVNLILQQTSGAIKRAASQEEEIRDLQHRIDKSTDFSGIVGRDPQMQMVFKLIEDIAPTDATVLIQGESGTGKELVARAVHHQSLRKDAPFIVINCSAYPTALLESEIFGHEKGAFTGALRQKNGRFEQADGGTVFLDEIGEIQLTAQIKLLRVIQTQKFERLGGEKTLGVNVRIIAATNKNLLEEVKRGNFREDLFYRLNVIPIQMPPLRNRRNDIPMLARHFLRHFAVEQGKEVQDFSSEAMRMLLDYSWPGNVRELENSIEHALVLAKGERIEATDLPSALQTAQKFPKTKTNSSRTILDREKKLLQETLEECSWNKKLAAQHLGISRSTLYSKLKKYRILIPTIH
jgi:two-component system response regulator HydG